MIRVFVDSSVLFAASLSETGGSREILRQALREIILLVTSTYVLNETEKNLTEKTPHVVEDFRELVETVPFEYVRPTKREVLRVMSYTVAKDAPIVAAAIKAKVDYLVSLDRRHLVEAPEVAERSGLTIVLPGQFLEVFRQNMSNANGT